MTHPEPKRSAFKKYFILSLLFVFILTGSWISYFLTTFDLNDYRRQVEEQLESVLSIPVQIGQLHYNLHETSIALKIDGLEIGSKETEIQLTAPKILLSLAWQGLFNQDIRFTELTLDKPELHIRPKEKIDEQLQDKLDKALGGKAGELLRGLKF